MPIIGEAEEDKNEDLYARSDLAADSCRQQGLICVEYLHVAMKFSC